MKRETYYKLAIFDSRSFTYRDGKVAYPSAEEAMNSVTDNGRGQYRISAVHPDGSRVDFEPFTIPAPAEPAEPAGSGATFTENIASLAPTKPAAPAKRPAHNPATRPMGGRAH